MCILFIAINQHPQHPLIIAANRDEYFNRPSQSMHYWPDQPSILAGRDLQKGGTWLGVNRAGYFCAVTNLRREQLTSSNPRSRGELVSRYLGLTQTEDSPKALEFHHWLTEHFQTFSPFNLVFGDHKQLWTFSYQSQKFTSLTSGYHSISNGEIDQSWPKMSRGVQRLTDIINNHQDRPIEFDTIAAIMRDQTQAPIDLLPETGISLEKEQQLSSIFIPGEHYGTRTTTLVRYAHTSLTLQETNYLPTNPSNGRTLSQKPSLFTVER